MPLLDLTDQEAQSLLNIVATTKEHAWLVTNPLVQKIGALLQQKDSPHGGVDQERRAAEHGGGATQASEYGSVAQAEYDRINRDNGIPDRSSAATREAQRPAGKPTYSDPHTGAFRD